MALPTIANPNFSVPAIGETFQYAPAGSSWTWSSATKSGIEGRTVRGLYSGQYGFFEAAEWVEQSVAFDGTPFQLRLAARWRLRSGVAVQTLRVTIDGATVADFALTTAVEEWAEYTSPTITPTPGTRAVRLSNPVALAQICVDSIEVLAVTPTTTPGRLLCYGPGRTGLVSIS